MLFSQLYPICFLFLLTLLHLKLHFGYFPYFFSFYIQLSAPFHDFLPLAPFLLDIFLVFLQYIYPIFTSISRLSSPCILSFGYFPCLSSIYVQFSVLLHVFLLLTFLLLDIFLLFLQYISNSPLFFINSASLYY